MRADLTNGVAIYLTLAVSTLAGCTAHKVTAQPTAETEQTAVLQAELDQRSEEVDDLKGEIDRLRTREDDLTQQLKQALRSSPGKTISDRPSASGGTTTAQQASVRELQDELKRERQRRQQLEQQLARLKTETSNPPVASASLIPPEAVEEPRLPPQPPRRIAESELSPEAAPPPEKVPAEPSPRMHDLAREPLPLSGKEAGEIAALRMRGIEQETLHQDAMTSLARVLDADRRKQEDLEAQIVALQTGAPGTAGAVAADESEVYHLRTRLEAERHKNAELMAKLKLASRVTDLVFRMQNQGAAPANIAPAPAPPPAPRAQQYSQEDVNPSGPRQPYIQDGEVNQPIEPNQPQVRQRPGPREGQNEVPQVEVPPVFPDGPVETEETTQD